MSRFSLLDYNAVRDRLRPMPDADPFDAYTDGFIGAYYDPEEHEILEDVVRGSGLPFDASSIAHTAGFAESGAGKVILLHKEVEKIGWGSRIGYPNQAVGDCVSHGTAKAMGHTLACSVTHGTGSVPATNGVEARLWPIASETHYWFRGHGGDGWTASASLRVVKTKTGIVIRKNLPGVCDLTTYSRETAHRYGSSPPPESVRDMLDDHPVMTFSECRSFEEVRDMIAAGYGVQTDGGEGFAKTTDENYVAARSGSWSHSMAVTGVIDTTAFRARYGCGGIVIQNSWGGWNRPPETARVMGTNERLPAGAFVALWRDVSRRSYFAISTVRGWPARHLPDWSLGDLV